jgi:hypothetical protein
MLCSKGIVGDSKHYFSVDLANTSIVSSIRQFGVQMVSFKIPQNSHMSQFSIIRSCNAFINAIVHNAVNSAISLLPDDCHVHPPQCHSRPAVSVQKAHDSVP